MSCSTWSRIPVSLETPVGDGESMYADLIEDIHSERPDESTSKKLRRNELAEAMLLLNPRMRACSRSASGSTARRPQTLEEVGAGSASHVSACVNSSRAPCENCGPSHLISSFTFVPSRYY